MKNLAKFLILTLLFGGMVAMISCSDDSEDPQPKSTATDIIKFSVAEQVGDAVIDAAKHSVDVEVAATRDITILRPYFTLSLGATAAPESGTEGDYSSPVTITVTAEDNTTTEDWTLTVTKAVPLSSETKFLTFTIPEETGDATINDTDSTIDIQVANDTDLAALTPTFTLSEGATSSPTTGTEGDYSSAVTITVIAEDNHRREWTVTVTEAAGQ